MVNSGDWLSELLGALRHYSSGRMRTFLVRFYEAAQGRFGTNASYTGPGDIIGGMGPFGLLATFFTLAALLFVLAGVKTKTRFKGWMGLLNALAAVLFGIAWVLLWVMPGSTYFTSTGTTVLMGISIGVCVLALALLILSVGQIRAAGRAKEQRAQEIAQLRNEAAALRQQIETLKRGGNTPPKAAPAPEPVPQAEVSREELPVRSAPAEPPAPVRETLTLEKKARPETALPTQEQEAAPAPQPAPVIGTPAPEKPASPETALPGQKQEAAPESRPGRLYLEFHTAGKVNWTLSEDALTIVRKGMLAVPGTYPLAEITNITHKPAKGKFTPSNISVFIGGKEYLLTYFDEERAKGEQAYQYLSAHTGSAEQRKARADFEAFKAGKERRVRCNVCGQLFCYSYQDVLKNQELAKQAGKAAILGALNTIGTSQILGAQQQAEADRKSAQIRDFSRCPNCNSTDLKQLTDEEYQSAIAARNAPSAPSAPSAADELKKFKELLDLGILTQEEFDAKKKQLLGL